MDTSTPSKSQKKGPQTPSIQGDSPSHITGSQNSCQPKYSDFNTLPNHAPKDLAEAEHIMRLVALNNHACKKALKLLKIVGAQNAKLLTKRNIIAHKMVQRSIKISDVIRWTDGSDCADMVHIHRLPTTTIKLSRFANGEEKIIWARGDIPVVVTGEIAVRIPVLGVPQIVSLSGETEIRRPDFQANEYCRLLHVLADSRLTATRQSLMECLTREELDQEIQDPWTDRIAPLFNDEDFKPVPNDLLAGGVCRSDICMINPSLRPFIREGGVLKRKFGEFKSLYGTCVSRFEASGQGDPDAFATFADGKSYIMYAYCFLKLHPVLQPLVTRALDLDSQREEGVGSGVSPYGYGGNAVSKSPERKRKKLIKEISVAGVDDIVSALKPQDTNFAKDMENAEREKVRYEVLEAQARSTRSALDAISKAKEMIGEATNPEERAVFESLVQTLMGNLERGAS